MDRVINVTSLINLTETELVNRIVKDIDPHLLDRYITNRAVEEPAYSILIFMYTILIVVGAAGNTLVIEAVVRKPAMRTARNMFIVNLAVSDLLLCTVTMPLTLMEILTKHWPLGNYAFICKTTGALQAISIFVSTISITAIALDRYQVIVYPTKESLQLMGAAGILSLIWLIAVILASPIFIYRTLKHHDIKLSGIDGLDFCVEDWPINHGRAIYSFFSLVVQYILPIIIVSVAYLCIYYKLRVRYGNGYVDRNGEEAQSSTRKAIRGRRLQRTNLLLAAIAVIFGISWLPLNLFNLFADLYSEQLTNTMFANQTMPVIYAVCHMMGMSSACSNPLLYGWLNDNFRKEFREIMCKNGGSGGRDAESQRLSERQPSKKSLARQKPDVITLATTDYHQGATVDTEMSVLAKC